MVGCQGDPDPLMKKNDFTQVYKVVRGKNRKTRAKTKLLADNLTKLMQKQTVSRTTL